MFINVIVCIAVLLQINSAVALNAVNDSPQSFIVELQYKMGFRGDVDHENLIANHSRELVQIRDPTYHSFGKKHNFFLKLSNDCFSECHNSLKNTFGSKNYQTISAEYGSVYITEDDLQDYLKVTNEHDSRNILSYTPMTANSKISHSVLSGCHEFNEQEKKSKIDEESQQSLTESTSTTTYSNIGKQKVSKTSIILVETAALEADELESIKVRFLAITDKFDGIVHVDKLDMTNMIVGESSPVQFHVTGIDHTCDKTLSLINELANYREIMWVARRHEVHLFNRWAKPICQTGDGTNQAISVQGNLNGENQVIAVSDTGIDMSNCYFKDNAKQPIYTELQAAKANLQNSVDTTQRKVIQYVYMQGTSDITDDGGGHGTHVAGTVAGLSSISYGDFVKYNGMSKNAKISFFDIGNTALSSAGSKIQLPSGLQANLFDIQAASGARIFSNSWGSGTSDYTDNCRQSDKFMYDNQDALVLFAAGNEGDLTNAQSSVASPGGAKNVLTVGASLTDNDVFLAFPTTVPGGVTDEFSQQSLASFSSQGPTTPALNARIKPDVLAPGWWVSSASGKAGNSYDSKGHCTLRTLQGTSMATPAAAGTAGLIRQYFMDGFYPSGSRNSANQFTPMGSLLKAIIAHSGQKITNIVKVSSTTGETDTLTIPTSDYPNNYIGFGRMQIDTVLNFGLSTNNPLSLQVIGSYTDVNTAASGAPICKTTSSSFNYYFKTGSSSNKAVRVTLAYSDDASNNQGALRNDISFVVNKCSNSVVPTNSLTSDACISPDINPPSATGSKPLQMYNNANPTANTVYRVKVTCTAVTSDQPFSVVMTQDVTKYPASDDNNPFKPYTADTGDIKSYISEGASIIISVFAVLTFILLILVVVIYYAHKRADKLEEDEITAAINSLAKKHKEEALARRQH